MTETIDLTLGDHVATWTCDGYEPLVCTINVTDTEVTCVSVEDGTCGVGDLPYVIANGLNVTGHLVGGSDICTYIDSARHDNLTNKHLVALYYQFIGLTDQAESTRLTIPVDKRPDGFPSTIENKHLVGSYYYFIGLTSPGNDQTGCEYT